MTKLAATVAPHWLSAIEAEILDMEADSQCARDCAKVIAAADALLELCADIGAIARQSIIRAAARQVDTYYFG